jgi:hypothetical protein
VKKLALCLVLFAVLLLASTGLLRAQAMMAGDSAFIDLLRSDIKKERTDIINKVMQFSGDDAAAFWPLFKEYQAKMDKIGDENVEFIKEYAGIYWNMTNQQAKDIGDGWFDMRLRELELRQEYFGKFSEALSPAQALKIMQLDYRLDLVVDMQIVSEMPMIE